MAEIVSGASYATFINTFRCQPSSQDEVVRINVEIIEEVASTYPGFISAAVHRSRDGTRVFNYLQSGLIDFEPHECDVVHVGERRREQTESRPEN